MARIAALLVVASCLIAVPALALPGQAQASIESPTEGQQFTVMDTITCSSIHGVMIQNVSFGDRIQCNACLTDTAGGPSSAKSIDFLADFAIGMYTWFWDLSHMVPTPVPGGTHHADANTSGYHNTTCVGQVQDTHNFTVNADGGGDPEDPPQGDGMGQGGDSW
ncbi:MAG TPA: hypothetical protein PLD23_01950 [Armatimonadota bacterium]|nr:hypothetical protein [Armatimonadota bacterium]